MKPVQARPASVHRPVRLGLAAPLALAVAFVALSVVAPSAFAVQTHGLEFSFDGTGSAAGPFTDLGSIAIDQSTGDVFAIDRGAGGIDKFNASGTPQNFSDLGSSTLNVEATCPNFQFPPKPGPGVGGYYHGRDDIAVDSSGGPNDGNIYVATDSVDPGAPEGTTAGICAYNSAGEFLWKDNEQTGDGLAVDPSGHLWLGAFSYAEQFEIAGSPPEVLNVIPTFGAERLAIDSNENVYINFYGDRHVDRYKFSGLQSEVQAGPTNALAVNPVSNHVYVANNEAFREYGLNGTPLLSEAGEDYFSSPEGIAVNDMTGAVYVSDATTNRVYVFGPIGTFAAVTTGPTSDVRRTTAIASGTIDPNGGGSVASCYIQYGKTKSYGKSAACNQPTPYATSTEVTANLSGLDAGAIYHYRLFAADAAGTNRGKDQTFTTPYVSALSTDPASSLNRTSATLNGSLDPDGVSTSYYFQWGLTTGYGNASPTGPPGESVGSTPGTVSLSTDIVGLEPATTYHFRIVGRNSEGMTLGEDETFTTAPPIRGLATAPATEIGPVTAALNGTLDPDGFDTTYYFEWGPDTSYGNLTPISDAGSTPGGASVSATISGLEDYTEYHYRIVATNSFGTTVGEDMSLLSAPPSPPSIAATGVRSVTNHGAMLTAEIIPGYGPTVFRFQYGTDASYVSRTPLSESIGADDAAHQVSATIEGLQPGTTYHFRAVGINFFASTLGPDRTFTTSNVPRIDSISASTVTQTTAILRAQISASGAATTYHFEYGADSSYGERTPESASIGADTTDHTVASTITDLTPGTTYHFRLVASNEDGTVSGSDQVFNTALSSGERSRPTVCKRPLIRRHGQCVRRHRSHRKAKHRPAGRQHA